MFFIGAFTGVLITLFTWVFCTRRGTEETDLLITQLTDALCILEAASRQYTDDPRVQSARDIANEAIDAAYQVERSKR